MNKIKIDIGALEALRAQLPDRPLRRTKPVSVPQEPQAAPPERLDDAEAEAYGNAFDALLTLWQAVGTMRALPRHVRVAQTAATLKLRPLLAGAMKAAS